MPTHWESRAEPIPGYRLVERLGRGGFGEVWKAEAPGGLAKAIKFVHGEMAGGEGHHAQQELKALERVRGIRHPFILSTERFDIIDGQLMIVMEIADCSLEHRLRDHQRQGLPGIPRAELLGYMAEAAEALDLMSNDYDLQHLDIKPQNIFLIGGHVKVADFGLVKDLEGCTASVTGGVTPVYAPPETFDGWVSRNSDQYSLAIVYQEMLTGKRPFPGPSARQYMMQHLTADPDLSILPSCDRGIVRRALSKDPKARFPSCMEFVNALKEAGQRSRSTSLVDSSSDTVDVSCGEATVSTRLAERVDDQSNECKTAVRPRAVLDRAALKASSEGTLRPTLVIGLGESGLDTLDRMRTKLSRRFGEMSSWPVVRLMGIDVESAMTRPRIASMPRETLDQFLLCRYRKPNQFFQAWDDLKHLSSWLDPNLMFQISNSGGTNGYRGLGRLAFFENYRRILARLRTEVEALLDPVRVQSAVSACGRALRTDEPRVCVVASMGGGLGSGMFIDLCYVIRQVLLEAGVSSPDIEGYLIAGAKTGNNLNDRRRVNSHALAKDILNFTLPDSSFTVDFEGHGERHHFVGAPAKAFYYFDADSPSLPEPRPEAVQDLVADLLIHSSATAVGKEMDRIERLGKWPMHRGIGLFSLSYPQRELLWKTSARLCLDVVNGWLEPLSRLEGDAVSKQASEMIASAGFDSVDITNSLLAACNSRLSEPIHVLTARLVADIEEELIAAKSSEQEEVLKRAMHSLKELLGMDPDENESDIERIPVYVEALTAATNDLASELLQPLCDALSSTLDRPGMRMERARKTWEGFSQFLLQKLDQMQEAVRTEIQRVCRRARQLRDRLSSTGAAHASNATRIELLQQYADEKLTCRLREQVVQVFLVLRAKLSDWSRDFVRVRQSVERLQQGLKKECRVDTDPSQGWACQTMFPGGVLALDQASDQLYTQASPIAAQELDGWIQSSTISSLGGLWAACNKDEAFEQRLPGMIVATAMRWLQEGIGEADVAQAFFDRHSNEPEALVMELRSFYDWASPTIQCRAAADEVDQEPPVNTFVLIAPRSGAGEAFGQHVRAHLPASSPNILMVGDECVFCRVQSHSSLSRMLPKWILESKAMYDASRMSRLSPDIFPVESTVGSKC